MFIDTTDMKKDSKIIFACRVLLNLCILNKDYLGVAIDNIKFIELMKIKNIIEISW